MRQLWLDIRGHKRAALVVLSFWLVLLVLTALTWNRGMPGWVFFIHLLLLPLLVGAATSEFRLSSGLAGLAVSLLDLLVVTVAPLGVLAFTRQQLPEEQAFTGLAAVFELLEFVVLMGVPGFLLGLLGGALWRIRPRRRQSP